MDTANSIARRPAQAGHIPGVGTERLEDWHLLAREGPVLATAIHDGHRIRPSLRPFLAIDDMDRRREEDPLTGVLCSLADTSLLMRTSRFEFDVNRPREKAISKDPADTWGLKIWRDELPEDEIAASLAKYDRFYQDVSRLLDRRLETWGSLLLLDIHSYNHRRDGAQGEFAPQQDNPDIDLGVTTLDATRWGRLLDTFSESLAAFPVAGKRPDVRRNVRYPTGGFFPEWVYSRYGSDICTISLEYKKIYMDEWEGKADLAVLEGFRTALENALAAVRPHWNPRS